MLLLLENAVWQVDNVMGKTADTCGPPLRSEQVAALQLHGKLVCNRGLLLCVKADCLLLSKLLGGESGCARPSVAVLLLAGTIKDDNKSMLRAL